MNREILEKQFVNGQIKKRKGNFGSMIDYVETQLVIQRLNDAFDGQWSFEIVEHEITQDNIIVIGRLEAEGFRKMQFGSNKITKSKSGDTVSIGDDFKAASSDCLKKCATLFGVGLHLYGESIPEEKEVPEERKPEFEDKKFEFNVQDEIPPSPPDKERLERMSKAYFAQIKDIVSDENLRRTWQKNNIGKWSTKEWNEKDFEVALDIIKILKDEKRTKGLVAQVCEKLSIDHKVMVNFIDAYFISKNVNMQEEAERMMQSVLTKKEVEKEFLSSMKKYSAWKTQHNGKTEELIQALTLCKDKDINIVKSYIKSTTSLGDKPYNIPAPAMGRWKDELAKVMVDMNIEPEFITQVLPDAVPF